MYFIIILVVLILILYFTGGKEIIRPKQYKGPISNNFDGTHFYNTYNKRAKRFIKFWEMRLLEKFAKWPTWVELAIPTSTEDDDINIAIDAKDKIKITFVNHATVLIQIDTTNILIDPIWSTRASPFSYIGPKRVHSPGIPFDLLPNIDVILVSHDHYDHLDIPTLKKLQKKFNSKIFVGLGVKKLLNDNKINNVIELDWWDTLKINENNRDNEDNKDKNDNKDNQNNRDLVISYTPATHWSARGILDVNTTLWGGFFITAKNKKIYFSGDTSYSGIFAEIKEKCGAPDVSLLPIGAYLPEWFMKPSHISPDEAVQAHITLNSKKSIGIHWGTFQLSAEGREQPLSDLEKSLKEHNINEQDFITLKPGESFYI